MSTEKTPTSPRLSQSAAIVLFAVAIFGAAFLLFAIQPMVGKRVLPWFGGVPSVWMLCLAFYQTTLLVGYAYAHALSAWVPLRRQPWLHAGFFLASLALLPVLPSELWKPDGAEDASSRIITMLTANVALPFALLSATGPLVQAWFARGFPDRSPYALYAVSNLGSLLALLCYPTLIEPAITVTSQSALWSWGFGITGLLVLASAFWSSRVAGELLNEDETAASDTARLSAADVILWLWFPAAAVALFMGVTNALTIDIASVPFLWIVPLSIYLVTLILTFASERAYQREPFIIIAALLLSLLAAPSQLPDSMSLLKTLIDSMTGQIVLYSLALFFGCMVAHGELYRLRPPPARLTSFYLAISAGGALGGLFVALVAPRLFVGYYELPLAVALTVVGVIVVAWRSHRFARERVALALATACALVAFGLFLSHREGPGTRILSAERNFFGVLRVIEKGQPGSHRWVRVLRHGTTLHGRQFQLDKGRAQPTSYYGRATGIGLLVERRGQHGPLHIGVIGLGVGTIAAYGREDDRITFYELDSDVVHIARDAGYFSYLSDSRADVEVVLGDARLSLEREVTRRFDVLVLDAFSSDAVPTHLLTREAFELYARHISEDGVLAAHVSNKHLDLTPLVAKLGLTVGMSALAVETDHMPNLWTGRSQWVLLARDPKILADLQRFVQRQAAVLGSRKLWIRPITSQMLHSAPLWTDDYSNLFELVKTRFSFSIR